jgi:hypothetical protein
MEFSGQNNYGSDGIVITFAKNVYSMETSLRIKVSELDLALLKLIKKLFNKDREVTLTISSATDFGLNKPETKEEYFARLKHAMKNLDEGKGIEHTEEQLNEFVLEHLKR